jgi:hypothetical protein
MPPLKWVPERVTEAMAAGQKELRRIMNAWSLVYKSCQKSSEVDLDLIGKSCDW